MFENLLNYLKENLPQKIIDGGYNNYEIFGKQAENPISETIEEYLISEKLQYSSKRAANKNQFPDLEVTINGIVYALEHKAGVCNMKGIEKSSAANDLGTLNAYPKKLEKYNDNIYCTFVKYSVLQDNTIRIEDIYFDKIYTFIGKGTGFYNQLQYREKDGNLRPKSWTDMSQNKIYFNTLDEFKNAIEATNQYRSERIVLKHLEKCNVVSLQNIKNKIDVILKNERVKEE